MNKCCVMLRLILILKVGFLSAGPAEDMFSTAHWGACIINCKTQEVIAHNESQLFVPASVTKLFTAAAALQSLGPTHTFDTIVKTTTPADREGKVYGNIYLIGGGDPTLTSKQLQNLAQKVYEKGVRTIYGKLVIDTSYFKGNSLPLHAEWEDLGTDYGSEISALSVNDNIIDLTVIPNPKGEGKAEIGLNQEVPICELTNKVETSSEAKTASIQCCRGIQNNCVELKGVIPASGAPVTTSFSVHQPEEYARKIFLKALTDKGIRFFDVRYKIDAATSHEIARNTSIPLSEILKKMNKYSHNLTAEMLARSNQPKAVENLMGFIDVKSGEFFVHDGSGLSRHNLVSPLQTCKFLEYMKNSPYSGAFRDSLAIAGLEGTLSKRFTGIKPGVVIRAKSGSMSGIANLVGYVELPNSEELVFAIFINNSKLSGKETAEALDNLLMHNIRSYFSEAE